MRKYIFWLIMIIIMAVMSLYLRLYRLEDRMLWIGDVARDITVASHIVDFHEFPLIGHSAYYFEGSIFHYPPYYYYLLSVPYLYFHDPLSVLRTVVIGQAFIPIIVLLLGAYIFSFPVGFCCGIFLVFSAYMIGVATPWTAYVAPIFLFFGLFIMEYAKRHDRFIYWFLGMGSVVFGGMIHFSVLICACIILVTDLFGRQTWKQRICKAVFVVTLICLLYIPLYMDAHSFSTVLGQFSSPRVFISVHQLKFSTYFLTLQNLWLVFLKQNGRFALISAIMMGILCCFQYRNVFHFFKRMPYAVFILLLLPLFGVVKQGKPMDYYVYTCLFPFFLLFLSTVLFYGIEKQRFFYRVLICVYVCVFVYMFMFCGKYVSVQESNMYGKTRAITSFIYDDAAKRRITTIFSVLAGEGEDYAWSSPIFWHFMEGRNKEKVSTVVNYGKNLEIVIMKPYVYLICQDYGDRIEKECLGGFVHANPAYRMQTELVHDFGENYRIFLYTKSE